MDCINCHYPETRVVDTYRDERRDEKLRRRECIKCGVRFTTREHLRDDFKRNPVHHKPTNVLPK